MEKFDDDEHMLTSTVAHELYQKHAQGRPIFDFHTHLPPQLFASNCAFQDITELWIDSDPYKWRAMRMNGIPEAIITGETSPRQRFENWARTLPKLIGNPLYDWSGREMLMHFGLEEPLSEKNSENYWNHCNGLLRDEPYLPQGLLLSAGVEAFATSDTWTDSLVSHRKVQEAGIRPLMLPSLRADDLFRFTQTNYRGWLCKLGNISGVQIDSIDSLLIALAKRINDFAQSDCTLADHGMDTVKFSPCTYKTAASYFAELLQGARLPQKAQDELETFLLIWLSGEYAARGWTMQLHIGARREASNLLHRRAQKTGGNAVMRTPVNDEALIQMFNAMESTHGLPRIILYPANICDFEWMACLGGAFVEDNLPAKVQLGASWWYNDNIEGIERFIHSVGNQGILMHSYGMNTDSRSFLSSVRQDYFRRVLCRTLGEWITEKRLSKGRYPCGELVEAISFRNAERLLKPLKHK